MKCFNSRAKILVLRNENHKIRHIFNKFSTARQKYSFIYICVTSKLVQKKISIYISSCQFLNIVSGQKDNIQSLNMNGNPKKRRCGIFRGMRNGYKIQSRHKEN